MRWTWEWPRGKMAWLFWNSLSPLGGSRLFRLGPLNLTVDTNDPVASEEKIAFARKWLEEKDGRRSHSN